MDSDFKLCYVNGDWAWFTTQDVSKQWGDDWNDAPYEHNAGTPYAWAEYMTRHDIEPYRLKTLPFSGDFSQPCSDTMNSRYSVDMINAGAIPWLTSPSYGKPTVIIPAGTTLPDFIRLVKQAGGMVYLPVEGDDNTNMTTVHVCCCLCTRQETVQVALPDGWRVDDIYEEDDALCPDHQAVEGFIASQCPGCVGGWGDCNLWRDFAFSRRGQTGLTENDLTSIRAGICPRRTNGTMVFSRETGVQSIDLSTAAPSEAGVALATAITEYIERYK